MKRCWAVALLIAAWFVSSVSGPVVVAQTLLSHPAYAQTPCVPGWDGVRLIDGESLSGWTVETDIGASGSVELTEGHDGQGIQLNWNIGTGDWVQGKYSFPATVDLSGADIFGVSLRGGGATELPNTISIMFADANDVFYGYNMEGKTHAVNQIDRWLINLSIPKKALYFFFSLGTETGIDWTGVNRFFIVVKRPGAGLGGGSGRLRIDEVKHDSAALWPRQRKLAKVAANRKAASRAIDYIMSQQRTTGLFLSWREEPSPKAWLYDQALALIALTRAGRWKAGLPVTEAARAAAQLVTFLERAQKDDGHWARGWNPETGEELLDDGWVGDQAWSVMGLALYSKKSGSTSARFSAQRGASWLAARIDTVGKVVDSTEGNVDVWWALVSTARLSDAHRIERYLLDPVTVWDAELKYWWRGFKDPVVAVDAATWLSAFARHTLVRRPERAKAALGFVRRALVTTSADQTSCGLDGLGPVGIWNEGTAQYVAAGGEDAQAFLDGLLSQQNPDGSLPGSPENWTSDTFGWLTTWSGIAPTAWLFFAITREPFP